jgi:ADP-ribose/FAD diphosphatase
MQFCNQCGARVARAVPDGEERERWVCPGCGTIHYENPKTVVGCIVEHEGGILLCKRAIEPARGGWTMPAGYQEVDESAVQGAVRETREEALAEVEVVAPHAWLDVPHIGQSYALFHARLRGASWGVGQESLETRLFDVAELPWAELAFPVITMALRLFVDDRAQDRSRVHVGVVRWNGSGSRFDAGNYRLEDHIALPVQR